MSPQVVKESSVRRFFNQVQWTVKDWSHTVAWLGLAVIVSYIVFKLLTGSDCSVIPGVLK